MLEQPATVREWVDALSGPFQISERLGLDFDGCRIEVHSNSRALIDALANYYKPFVYSDIEPDATRARILAVQGPQRDLHLNFRLKSRPPGKRPKEEFVEFPDGRMIRKVRTGMLFFVGKETRLAYGTCKEHLPQVVNFINSRYVDWALDSGYLLAHASAVARGETGLALAGDSGVGKSTLAMRLLSAGTNFVSNDHLLLRSEGGQLRMRGVPKLPRVNPGTLLTVPALQNALTEQQQEELSRLAPSELWELEQKFDVDLDEYFGPGRFQLQGNLSALVILNWKPQWQSAGRQSRLSFRRVDLPRQPELVAAFRKSPGLFRYKRGESVSAEERDSRYIDVFGCLPVFEFGGGVDFESATRACAHFLTTGSMPGTETAPTG